MLKSKSGGRAKIQAAIAAAKKKNKKKPAKKKSAAPNKTKPEKETPEQEAKKEFKGLYSVMPLFTGPLVLTYSLST